MNPLSDPSIYQIIEASATAIVAILAPFVVILLGGIKKEAEENKKEIKSLRSDLSAHTTIEEHRLTVIETQFSILKEINNKLNK